MEQFRNQMNVATDTESDRAVLKKPDRYDNSNSECDANAQMVEEYGNSDHRAVQEHGE